MSDFDKLASELVDEWAPWAVFDVIAKAFDRVHDERSAEAARKAARSVDPDYQKIPF